MDVAYPVTTDGGRWSISGQKYDIQFVVECPYTKEKLHKFVGPNGVLRVPDSVVLATKLNYHVFEYHAPPSVSDVFGTIFPASTVDAGGGAANGGGATADIV